MAVISSERERRLWVWTAIVVVAIFATLGLARTLSDELGNRGLFDAVFGVGALLVLATIAGLAVRARPTGREVAAVIGVVAVYVVAFARMAIPEERTHLVEYGVVAALVHAALEERAGNGRGPRRPALVAALIATAVGTVDELVQLALPSRVFDVRDIGFNALAAGLAVGAGVALRWAGTRRRANRVTRPADP